MSSRDVQGETSQWTGSDARLWAAHQAMDQDGLLAYMLPTEIDVVITDHLLLLDDLDGLNPGAATDAEVEMQNYALARLRSFVESGIVTARHVNILSRLTIDQNVFPGDDESLRIADLDCDGEDFVDD